MPLFPHMYRFSLLFSIIVLSLVHPGLFAQPPLSLQSHIDTAQLRIQLNAFVEKQVKTRSISQVVLSPDGKSIAWAADGPNGSQVIYWAPLAHPENAVRITAGKPSEYYSESEPQWSPNGKYIAFLSDYPNHTQAQIYVAPWPGGINPDTDSSSHTPLTNFNGYVSHLHWAPDGKKLSVLYVDKASREPSPMAAENKAVGVIDSVINRDIQRVALVDIPEGQAKKITLGQIRLVTPAEKYVFEYDWKPDGTELAYTAAAPPGDDNWYIAGVYTQKITDTIAHLLYQPSWQVALPKWSPDGSKVAFIEGLMSDQGGTGGEIFTVSANGEGKAQNLTPDLSYTPAWFTWHSDNNIVFSAFTGGSTAICDLNTTTRTIKRLWKENISIQASADETSFAVNWQATGPVLAFIRMGWNALPEIWSGNFQHQTQITHLNDSIQLPMPKVDNIEWTNEGHNVQGWLLYPAGYDPSKTYPLLVNVHGGPAWIASPTWSSPDFNAAFYTQLGYFVFFPNDRGSYGQGEAFTRANRRDWGHGDLRDMLSGIDLLLRRYSIDSSRMGIMGWSYGGFSSMFAVTQTHRFKAAVAGAGAGDWLSYYGQNSIDKWMQSYFGASPYEDPEAYRNVSAMTYIRQVKTPTLVLVGEYDGEAPPPQSLQFWHALKELKVPAQLVIYPDEGHAFYKLEDQVDVTIRTIEWFHRYLQ